MKYIQLSKLRVLSDTPFMTIKREERAFCWTVFSSILGRLQYTDLSKSQS